MTVDRSSQASNYIIVAMGWILLAATLCQSLSPSNAAVALFGLVIAEIASRMLVTGFDQPKNYDALPHQWDQTLGRVLFRWTLLSISVLILNQIFIMRFFEHHQYPLICVIGLCLILALIRLVSTCRAGYQKRVPLMAQARNSILAGGVFCVAQIGSLNCDLVLSLAIALLLAVLALISVGAYLTIPSSRSQNAPSAQDEDLLFFIAPLVWRYADVLVIAWVLTPQNTLNYLVARGLAQMVFITFNLLSDRLTSTLFSAYTTGNLQHFAAISARTNLGFLLIGGGASLAALSLGVCIPLLFDFDFSAFRNILFWLVATQAAPAIFGATGLLLSITQCKQETIMLSLLGLSIFLSTLIFTGVTDPQQLAQIFAFSQLLIAAMAAVLLGLKFGIWPGPTAILFRQIKLF